VLDETIAGSQANVTRVLEQSVTSRDGYQSRARIRGAHLIAVTCALGSNEENHVGDAHTAVP
jgi:hypothetical protein